MRVERGEEMGEEGAADDGRGGVQVQNFSPSSQMLDRREREAVGIAVVVLGGSSEGVVSSVAKSSSAPVVVLPASVSLIVDVEDDGDGDLVGTEVRSGSVYRSSIVASSSQSKPRSPISAFPFSSSHVSSSSSSYLSRSSSQLSSPGSAMLSSRPRLAYRRSALLPFFVSEFMRRSVCMEARMERAGGPRGPLGVSVGTAAKLMVGVIVGSLECAGRGDPGAVGDCGEGKGNGRSDVGEPGGSNTIESCGPCAAEGDSVYWTDRLEGKVISKYG